MLSHLLTSLFLFNHSNFSTKTKIPEGSWDSHIHVIEPAKFPFPKNATGPREATMAQALSHDSSLGMANNVFVQISIYGTDNTWVLNALKNVGPVKGRGVVCFDPDEIDLPTLQSWHALGVRGVRVSLRSTKSVLSPTEIQTILRKYAEKIRPMKTWSIGLYADMKLLNHIEPLLPELDVKIVLEHFASPAFLPLDPDRMAGWRALERMMRDERVFVKISGPYLFSKDS